MDGTDHIKSILTGRKTAIFAVLAVTMCTAAVLLSQQPVLAQTSNNTGANGSTVPTIKGSVSISNATNAFVKANVKVDFSTAENTAKAQMTNGVIVGGRLSDVQGYLVYAFTVANYDAGTSKLVIVDAGNGQVLYTSSEMPLYNGGIGGGYGGCHHGAGDKAYSGSHSTNGSTSGMSGGGISILGSNL